MTGAKLPSDILQEIVDVAFLEWDKKGTRHHLASLCLIDRDFCLWSRRKLYRKLRLKKRFARWTASAFCQDDSLRDSVEELSILDLCAYCSESESSSDSDKDLQAASQLLTSLSCSRIERLELLGGSVHHSSPWPKIATCIQTAIKEIIRSSRFLRHIRISKVTDFAFAGLCRNAMYNIEFIDVCSLVDSFGRRGWRPRLHSLTLVSGSPRLFPGSNPSFRNILPLFDLSRLSTLIIGFTSDFIPTNTIFDITIRSISSLKSICFHNSLLIDGSTLNLKPCTQLRNFAVVENIFSATHSGTTSLSGGFRTKIFEMLNDLPSVERIFVHLTSPDFTRTAGKKLDHHLAIYFSEVDNLISAAILPNLRRVVIAMWRSSLSGECEEPFPVPLHHLPRLSAGGHLRDQMKRQHPLMTKLCRPWGGY